MSKRRKTMRSKKRPHRYRVKDAGRFIDEKKEVENTNAAHFMRDKKPDLVLDTGARYSAEDLAKTTETLQEAGVKFYDFTTDDNPTDRYAADNSHSIGFKAYSEGGIARSLLNTSKWKAHAGVLAPPLELDDRPLIDLLHEATFTKPLGMYAVQDPYALRMLLRKAHCFTLDDATSAMVADFSIATSADLEASRQLAMPPFPVTWIDLNNHARLKRMKEINFPLRDDDPSNPPAARIGWLIYPSTLNDGWYATYVTVIDVGIWVAPLSYWWHAGSPAATGPATQTTDGAHKLIEWLLFGTSGNVHGNDAHMHACRWQYNIDFSEVAATKDIMSEMAGELRHIWGCLIALSAGGARATVTPQSKPARTPPIMKNGKPLLPLEHKVLHLHLNKKPPQTVITQAITHHHNRWHEVRAHFRTYKSGKRVPVRSHARGDEKLGRIEKTYKVEK